MKCEICGKDIEIKDAYSPIRYKIGVLSNPNQSMLARSVMYEFVCEKYRTLLRFLRLFSIHCNFLQFLYGFEKLQFSNLPSTIFSL